MPADILLSSSSATNTPSVDLGAGREPTVNQEVRRDRPSFDNEYRQQVEARKSQNMQHRANEQRQADARKADNLADIQADKHRRLAQDRKMERAENERRRSESGNRLPARRDESANTRNTTVRSENRASNAQNEGQSSRPADSAANSQAASSEKTTIKHSGDTSARDARKQQFENSTNIVKQEVVETIVEGLSEKQSSEAVVVAGNSDVEQLEVDISAETVDSTVQDNSEGENTADLDAYFLQQLNGLSVEESNTAAVENSGGENESAEIDADIVQIAAPAEKQEHLELERWMEQALSAKSSHNPNLVETDVDSEDSTAELRERLLANSINTETRFSKPLTPETDGEQPLTRALVGDKQSPSTSAIANAGSGLNTTPLAQAIESVNRNALQSSEQGIDLASLKQAKETDNVEKGAVTLDELKQIMQERKALLESGQVKARTEGEPSKAALADAALLGDRKPSNGIDVLRQLRIPGTGANKSGVDDSAANTKQPAFGRALEQVASFKSEDSKPFSTQISTPVNKPGFVPEFNQRIMMMIGQKIQSAEIKLTPEELGPIDVSVKFNQDQQASIVFASQHSVTRDALEQGAQRLRDMLEQNGVELDSVDIQENLANSRDGQRNENDSDLISAEGQKEDSEELLEGDEQEESALIAETDNLVDFYA